MDPSFDDLVLLAKVSVQAKRASDMLTANGASNSDSLVLLMRAASAAAREEYDTNSTAGQKVEVALLSQAWR